MDKLNIFWAGQRAISHVMNTCLIIKPTGSTGNILEDFKLKSFYVYGNTNRHYTVIPLGNFSNTNDSRIFSRIIKSRQSRGYVEISKESALVSFPGLIENFEETTIILALKYA